LYKQPVLVVSEVFQDNGRRQGVFAYGKPYHGIAGIQRTLDSLPEGCVQCRSGVDRKHRIYPYDFYRIGAIRIYRIGSGLFTPEQGKCDQYKARNVYFNESHGVISMVISLTIDSCSLMVALVATK